MSKYTSETIKNIFKTSDESTLNKKQKIILNIAGLLESAYLKGSDQFVFLESDLETMYYRRENYQDFHQAIVQVGKIANIPDTSVSNYHIETLVSSMFRNNEIVPVVIIKIEYNTKL